jgi:uncharacterized membrane protein (Fun14 family)
MAFALTLSDIGSVLIALVIGLLIGVLLKKFLEIGVILVVIVLVLLAIGAISPATVESFLKDIGVYATQAYHYSQRFAGLVPYNSIFFIIGLIIGLWKG